jgi:hypothetical protein
VAKRPPSSGTSGRSSGGMTGMTSRIIQFGWWPDLRKASTTLRRLAAFRRLIWLVSVRMTMRSSSAISSTSMRASSSLIPSAPMRASKLPSPYLSRSSR